MDFNAIREGARRARQDNYQDQLAQQQIEMQRLQLEKIRQQNQTMQYERVANSYLSNIPTTWAIAQTNGVDKTEFWQGQANAIRFDPNYAGMPTELQLLIRQKFLTMCTQYSGMNC